MKVMILNVSSGTRNDKTPWFKAMVSPQDSEGNSATAMDFYIEPDDYALVAGRCPCVANSGYKLRAGRNARNFEMMEISFRGFSEVQPLVAQSPAELPKPAAPAAKSA